ncbi:MAG: type I restriction enzyme HsdR N-terminal domain-containing protein [Alistipes sp.]|nr:type I restriction enzyme HsdR N-terminal domain-containing protein [Candidatus Alistipes equi]
MGKYPALKFPKVALRAKKNGAKNLIWDDIRKMWLVLTGEEWVRQHAIAFLISGCEVQKGALAMEYPVEINSQPQRADIVAFVKEKPWMLVECKAADVTIDKTVLDQAIRYNSVIGARYIFLTNGLTHYFFEIKNGTPIQIDFIPKATKA